ncbi:MAG TPA: leucyl aminopeptidase [Candidatus Limnocylindrales bacterium]
MHFRTVTSLDPGAIDALIVAVDRDGNALGGPPDAERQLAEWVARESGPAKLFTTRTHLRESGDAATRLVVVAAGRRAEYDRERARNVVSAGVKALWHSTTRRLAIVLDDESLGMAPAVRAAVEGVMYAMWRPDVHRTGADERRLPPLEEVLLYVGGGDEAAAEQAIERGVAVGEAVNFARRLANEPANLMTPTLLAEEARQLAERTGLEFEALDEDACRALGMGSYLSVARGSIEPPRLIVLRYRARGGDGYDLALVGKGITFDSGGISIKPAEDMHLMKYDMTGAASVIAALGAIAALRLPLNVIAVAPCTENLPGGSATKPGDVVKSMSGKTVEVINTDAEGRLVLIDALTYAQREGARRLVDVATLTGGIRIALGAHYTGLFGRPVSFVDSVVGAGSAAGERMWPMPLSDEYRDEMKSDIADIKNSANRYGSAIKGAAFIDAVIAEDAEWAHLDIAGSAWFEEDRAFSPKGPQGVPVRTLVALAEELAGS